MKTPVSSDPGLHDLTLYIRVKLSALWTAYMICYLYGDILIFFKTSTLGNIRAGDTGDFGTPSMLLVAVVLMAVPTTMIFLSLVLAPKLARYANMIFGVAYTILVVATTYNAAGFYILLSAVEAPLTFLIFWHAWKWPARAADHVLGP